ncbi:MAG: TVP38/TMEM64 family protein [Legionellales bacterium]
MTDKLTHLIKILCPFLVLIVIITCALLFQKYALEITRWINELGWLAPVLFFIIYCLATLMLLPTMVLTFAGGAIFGPVFGTILNLFGATCGSALAFLITRHLFYEKISQQKGTKLKQLIAGVNKRGWVFVALIRLFPILPFNLVNYGLGITAIKFRLYLITTFVFLIPTEIVYTYFGYAGMDALSNPGQTYKNWGMVLSGLTILALCITGFVKRKKTTVIV